MKQTTGPEEEMRIYDLYAMARAGDLRLPSDFR